MLLARASCRFGTITPPLLFLLSVIEEYARHHGLTVVVLSATDGQHAVYSGHDLGHAVDLRCHDRQGRHAPGLLKDLLKRLGPEFHGSVVHQGEPTEHLHLQLRRGVDYHPHPVCTHLGRFDQ